jgi:hypothetical protein
MQRPPRGAPALLLLLLLLLLLAVVAQALLPTTRLRVRMGGGGGSAKPYVILVWGSTRRSYQMYLDDEATVSVLHGVAGDGASGKVSFSTLGRGQPHSMYPHFSDLLYANECVLRVPIRIVLVPGGEEGSNAGYRIGTLAMGPDSALWAANAWSHPSMDREWLVLHGQPAAGGLSGMPRAAAAAAAASCCRPPPDTTVCLQATGGPGGQHIPLRLVPQQVDLHAPRALRDSCELVLSDGMPLVGVGWRQRLSLAGDQPQEVVVPLLSGTLLRTTMSRGPDGRWLHCVQRLADTGVERRAATSWIAGLPHGRAAASARVDNGDVMTALVESEVLRSAVVLLLHALVLLSRLRTGEDVLVAWLMSVYVTVRAGVMLLGYWASGPLRARDVDLPWDLPCAWPLLAAACLVLTQLGVFALQLYYGRRRPAPPPADGWARACVIPLPTEHGGQWTDLPEPQQADRRAGSQQAIIRTARLCLPAAQLVSTLGILTGMWLDVDQAINQGSAFLLYAHVPLFLASFLCVAWLLRVCAIGAAPVASALPTLALAVPAPLAALLLTLTMGGTHEQIRVHAMPGFSAPDALLGLYAAALVLLALGMTVVRSRSVRESLLQATGADRKQD